MSCEVCESNDSPCKSRGQSQQSRSRYTSDTDESNYDDSAYTSDLQSNDDCRCNDDNDVDCGAAVGNSCNGSKNNQKSCGAQRYSSNQQRSQQLRAPVSNATRTGGRLNRPSGDPPKKGCSCGTRPMPQENTTNGSRMYQQPSTSQPNRQSYLQQSPASQNQNRYSAHMSQTKLQQYPSSRDAPCSMGRDKQQSNGQYNMPSKEDEFYYQSESGNDMQSPQSVPCGGMACNKYGSQGHLGQQSQSASQRGELQQFSNQEQSFGGQSNGMNSLSRYQSPASVGKPCGASSFMPNSSSSTEGQNMKQVIADYCLPNESISSVSGIASQKAVRQSNSRPLSQDCGVKEESPCGCDSNANVTSNGDATEPFVCPSCAEFDNVGDVKCCDDPEVEQRCNPESVPLSEPELTDNKQKKKIGGHGFWQQMQFQIFQQQDGDDDNSTENNANEDQCICDTSQDDQMTEKTKKSGNKIWQKLTLDLFQSKDDDESGSENDSNSRQGWQQQLKFQLFQEKCQDDEQGDVENPVLENLINDQCTC